MDLHLGEDFHDSFIAYQTRMLKVFDRMTSEYGFHVLNASRSVRSVGQTCAGQLRKSLTSARLPKKKSAYYRRKRKPAQNPTVNVVDLNKEALS